MTLTFIEIVSHVISILMNNIALFSAHWTNIETTNKNFTKIMIFLAHQYT